MITKTLLEVNPNTAAEIYFALNNTLCSLDLFHRFLLTQFEYEVPESKHQFLHRTKKESNETLADWSVTSAVEQWKKTIKIYKLS